jgi:2-aminoadipate transaminase
VAKSADFDSWKHLYAGRTALMHSSAIRELMAVASRPDVIALSGGLPYTDPVGYERVAHAAREIMRLEGPLSMNYGPSDGYRPLKCHVRQLMAEDGMEVDEDDILFTAGAQQALEFTAKIFVDPGDVVIVEAPAYVGALQAFNGFAPKFVTVAMDDDGMDTDLLETALDANRGKVKFIYTVPNFNNPAGVTLSYERRLRLLELAREHDVLVIEDNPYGRLRYEGEHVPNLRSMETDIVYLGTFSKVFAPGLRVGWVTAPRPILDKYMMAKQAADLCSSSFAMHLLDRYFHENAWTKNVEALIDTYRVRRDTLLAALEEHFPEDAKWTHPNGGFFVWATLPEWLNTSEMLPRALEAKVAYVPGAGFYPDGSGTNCMRLNFSFPSPEEIQEGVKRLGKVIKEQMAVVRSLFGPGTAVKAGSKDKAGSKKKAGRHPRSK